MGGGPSNENSPGRPERTSTESGPPFCACMPSSASPRVRVVAFWRASRQYLAQLGALQCRDVVLHPLPRLLECLATLLESFLLPQQVVTVAGGHRQTFLVSRSELGVLLLQCLHASLHFVPLSIVLPEDLIRLRESLLKLAEFVRVGLQLGSEYLVRLHKCFVLSFGSRLSTGFPAVELHLLRKLSLEDFDFFFMLLLLLQQLLLTLVVALKELLETSAQLFVLAGLL